MCVVRKYVVKRPEIEERERDFYYYFLGFSNNNKTDLQLFRRKKRRRRRENIHLLTKTKVVNNTMPRRVSLSIKFHCC